MGINDLEDRSKHEDSSDTDSSSGHKPRMQFSGSCSFLVSLLGYSMGTSDFWRFPYLVFRNGGGAFLIPFALFMMISGMPMLFFEVTTSQFSGCGPISMWNMAPFFKGIGFTLLIINLMNNVYYNVLRAWILEYFVNTFKASLPWQHCNNEWNRPGCVEFEKSSSLAELPPTGNATYTLITSGNATDISTTQMTAAEQYWQYGVLQLSSALGNFDGVLWHFVLYVFIWRLLVSLCMIKSIKSIEKVMYVTVFVPIILMIIIFVRALTLKGATDGILYYVTPTFSRITDVKVWIEAALMATYTLGPGWGTIPTIGSHNKFHGNTVGYSILSTFLDFLSAVLNGLICFAILGVMAHDSGLELENTVTSGLSLGFTVYPTAFTYFPLPQVWSAVFFVNLLLVGLDSQVFIEHQYEGVTKMMSKLFICQVLSTETVMNCLQDIVPRWFIGRRRVYMIILLNIIFFILTIPFCTRGGLYLFQLLDWYAAAWTLLFVCFVECIVFTWIYGCERLNRDAMIMMGRPLPIVIRLFGSFLTPAAILVLLILSFLRYTPPKYGSYIYPDSAEAIGWCLAFAIISPMFIVFIYKLITSEGTFIEKLKSIRKSSDIWGPNDEVSMTTYHDNDEIIQSEHSVKSTLTYNIFGRSHSNRRQKYSVNINDEISYPMVNCNDTYKSKPNV